MTAAPDENRETIRAAFDAWQRGSGAITQVFAPDMVWHIEGRSAVAGTYRDRRSFVSQVLEPFGARFERGEPFRPLALRSIVADGDAVVVVWDGRGVANDGRPYENSYAWVMRLAGGFVVEGTAFFDSIAFDELWTRVQP